MVIVNAGLEGKRKTLTASKLLSIQTPEQVFSSPTTISSEFRALAKKWHPDSLSCPQAGESFAHLVWLRNQATIKWETGLWEGSDSLWLRTGGDTVCQLSIQRAYDTLLGREFLTPGLLVTRVQEAHTDFLYHAQRLTKVLPFADGRMRAAFEQALPTRLRDVSLRDGSVLAMQEVAPDLICLKDVYRHLHGALGARHGAWIISGLLSLVCYLEFAGFTHNNISLDTCFISPKRHMVALPSAWWFGVVEGSPYFGLPARTLKRMPAWMIEEGRAHRDLDLELIRALGRELLCDPADQSPSGMTPDAMSIWLHRATSGSAREDYRQWTEEVLPASYGARRFVALEITPEQVYGGKA